MKITRKQLRQLMLREFKFTGNNFVDDLDLLGGGPPPAESQEPSGGGGGGRIHQLVRIDFEPGNEFNPSSYNKVAIDVSAGSTFSKMREIYNLFSDNTKNKLYQMFPGGIDPEDGYVDADGDFIFDQDKIWDFRSEYYNLLNTMDDALPEGSDYEYFTIFHPSYASHGRNFAGANELEAIDLYRRVTGYTPDEDLLGEYEIIMHSASSLFG